MAADEERPDAPGIRPLRAVVRDGKVYLDMVSLVAGYRSRADALEARGYADVADLYRREADELDTAAIGWLSEGADVTQLPDPPAVIHVSRDVATFLADHLNRRMWSVAPDPGAVMAGRDYAGNRVQVEIRVDPA